MGREPLQERFQPLGVGCLGGKPLPALCKEQGKKPQQCSLDLKLVAGELGAVGILHLPQAEMCIRDRDKAVSRWERGIGLPDINTLEPRADVLGLTLAHLMHLCLIHI